MVTFNPVNLRYTICARAGDPLAREARARLIWAANTADATARLGLPTSLVSSVDGIPFRTSSPEERKACYRRLSEFYHVGDGFDIKLTIPPSRKRVEKEGVDPHAWQVNDQINHHVLPYTAVFHSRDPAINILCHQHKVPFIYEDHSESFHTSVRRPDEAQLNSPYCLAIIAIAPAVKTRLVGMGIDEERILVVESGLSPKSFDVSAPAYKRWRGFLLTGGYSHLAVYTGGMQEERDIRAAILAARDHPDCIFAFAGGHKKDLEAWFHLIAEEGIHNVRLLGYLSSGDALELQAAADILLYTRAEGPRAFITSPLKLFEYFAAGKKVVAAHLPQLQSALEADMPVTWYRPGRNELSRKIREALNSEEPAPSVIDAARAYARQYTWKERQRRIIEFAGITLPEASSADTSELAHV